MCRRTWSTPVHVQGVFLVNLAREDAERAAEWFEEMEDDFGVCCATNDVLDVTLEEALVDEDSTVRSAAHDLALGCTGSRGALPVPICAVTANAHGSASLHICSPGVCESLRTLPMRSMWRK